MTTTLSAGDGLRAASGRGRLPPATRNRRPALAALALLLILGGTLASALVAYRSGSRVDVLIAERDILPGQRVTLGDFGVARVATDSGGVVPASALQNFVGTAATTRIPQGTLVNRAMFLAGGVVPFGAVVVGIVLGAQQQPAEELRAGDVVRAYFVPRADTSTAVAGQPGAVLLPAARVVAVHVGSGDSTTVSLLVPQQLAPALMPAAAAGSVAVARLPDATVPLIDLRVG